MNSKKTVSARLLAGILIPVLVAMFALFAVSAHSASAASVAKTATPAITFNGKAVTLQNGQADFTFKDVQGTISVSGNNVTVDGANDQDESSTSVSFGAGQSSTNSFNVGDVTISIKTNGNTVTITAK